MLNLTWLSANLLDTQFSVEAVLYSLFRTVQLHNGEQSHKHDTYGAQFEGEISPNNHYIHYHTEVKPYNGYMCGWLT